MHEQKITWGWALRIIWGALWRWIVACAAVTIGLAILNEASTRMGGPSLDPIAVPAELVLWLLALLWALCATLRARHGGYRLVLVSGAETLDAFD